MPSQPRPRRATQLALAVALAVAAPLALAACAPAGDPGPQAASPTQTGVETAASTTPGPSGPVPSVPATAGQTDAPADAAAVAAVRARIDGARLDDPRTLDALAAARFEDGAPQAAAAALAEGAAGDARWAAAWTYATAGTDPAVLRPLLDDPDASVRSIAAAALTAWGDAAGIPVLVRLAAVEDRLSGSYPPVTVGAFALGSLGRLVADPPGDAAAPVSDRAAAWEAWIRRHDPASLAFDPDLGTWSVR